MNKKKLKLEGWKSKNIGNVGFFQCPYCGHCVEGIYIKENNMVKCYKCKKRFHKDKFKIVTLKKPVVICKVCGTEVSLTPGNVDISGGYSYLCPKCMNHVAIKFKNYVLQPQTVMTLKWNKDIVNRSLQLENNLFFATCKDKKDFLVLRIMQLMAKKERTFFLYIREKEQKAGLVFDIKKQKYIGFAVWTEGKNAILRQIFVVKDKRLKGYGTKLLKFWVENFAEKINDRFGLESPTGETLKILVKLGYGKNEGEHIKGIKCFFIGSG